MLNFSRLLAWWEARLARSHTPPAPFASPLAAQFWSDWRQKFAAVPAVIMGGFAVSILGARATGYSTTVDMLDLMFVLPLVLQATLLPVLFGLVIGSSAARNRVSGISHILATRPVSDAVLATSLLRTAALSMFLSWVVWIGGLLVAVGVAYLTADREAINKAVFLPVWQNALVAAWILVISWALVGCMASLVAIGRPWVWISVISTICILTLACVVGVFWSARHGTDALTVVCMLVIPFLFLLLAVSLFVAARRKRLIGEVVTWLSIIGWLAALAALIVALHISPQSGLGVGIAVTIYFGGFLAIPFMPLAGMPLAIHYNRHR